MENDDSDIIGSGPSNSSSSERRRAPLTRFGSLSFINDHRLASEMLAGNEKLLKQAFFNAAANIFVLLAILASIAVFYVLELFLRPLLWATLTGSFLYPFKKAATGCVQNWLNCLSDSGTPLFIGNGEPIFKLFIKYKLQFLRVGVWLNVFLQIGVGRYWLVEVDFFYLLVENFSSFHQHFCRARAGKTGIIKSKTNTD